MIGSWTVHRWVTDHGIVTAITIAYIVGSYEYVHRRLISEARTEMRAWTEFGVLRHATEHTFVTSHKISRTQLKRYFPVKMT